MMVKDFKKKQFYNITHVTLSVIAVAGVVGVAVIAPGVLRYAKPFLTHRKNQQRILQQRLHQLKNSGYIRQSKRGYRLTARGKKKLGDYEIKTLRIVKQRTWDAKWRIILFDIPEKRRIDRDRFRRSLHQLGFYALQQSVYIHPYPCEMEVLLLARRYRLSQYLCFLETRQLPSVTEKDVYRKYF